MTTQQTETRTIHGRPDWQASLAIDRAAAEHVAPGNPTYFRGSVERQLFIAAHIGDLHVPAAPGLYADSGSVVGQLTRAEYEQRTQATGVKTVNDFTCESARWQGAFTPERDATGRNTVAMALATARGNQIRDDRRTGALPSVWDLAAQREAAKPRCSRCGNPSSDLMQSSVSGAVCAECYDRVEA